MGSHEVYVTDACFWLDLDAGEIVPVPFQINCKWTAPDVVVREVNFQDPELCDNLLEFGLSSVELLGDQVREVEELISIYSNPSFPDISALVIAKYLNCTILTSDRDLRTAADSEGVPVHGTIWLLDQLVEKFHYLAPQQGARAIKTMLEKGRRLPEKECEKRIRKWRKKKSGR